MFELFDQFFLSGGYIIVKNTKKGFIMLLKFIQKKMDLFYDDDVFVAFFSQEFICIFVFQNWLASGFVELRRYFRPNYGAL